MARDLALPPPPSCVCGCDSISITFEGPGFALTTCSLAAADKLLLPGIDEENFSKVRMKMSGRRVLADVSRRPASLRIGARGYVRRSNGTYCESVPRFRFIHLAQQIPRCQHTMRRNWCLTCHFILFPLLPMLSPCYCNIVILLSFPLGRMVTNRTGSIMILTAFNSAEIIWALRDVAWTCCATARVE
jgi:hypothetical protein